MVETTIRLPSALWKRVGRLAVDEGLSKAEVVRRILDMFFEAPLEMIIREE
jgi:predicted DNA-binding protein